MDQSDEKKPKKPKKVLQKKVTKFSGPTKMSAVNQQALKLVKSFKGMFG
ncbi:hypothetical protein GJU40_05345 [Bacillus lacus]|uniref:Uncharacterized protein n=1 Tax=Metabacillus lacus TaxID=1983721 RepID=A0A7X2LXS4_9BACI|nr:hypothetical protein [Metabacillus lacus]MRX71601.1 hypothetical protein [Metabacillus lacus]